MLKITKIAPDRVDLTLSGHIDADAMRQGLDEMLAASEEVAHGKMLYKIPEFALPTLQALAVEAAYLPKLFALLGKFDKCAVLSDAGWIRTAAEIEGALFPGIDIKAFELDQVEEAENWLNNAG